MSNVIIKCPTCSTELEADTSLLGSNVTCPKCNNVFVAQGAPAAPVLQVAGSAEAPASGSPTDTEETLFDGGPDHKYFVISAIIACICPLPCIGIIFVPIVYLFFKSMHYTVTTSRIIVQQGILNKKRTEIRINDMRAVDLNRNILDQIVGCGTIQIGTAASAGKEIQMFGLRDAQVLVDKINSLRRS